MGADEFYANAVEWPTYPQPRMVPNTVSLGQGDISDEPTLFHIRNFQWAKDEWVTRDTVDVTGADHDVFMVLGWVVYADPVFTHISCMRVESERGVEFNGGVVVPSGCVVEVTRMVVEE